MSAEAPTTGRCSACEDRIERCEACERAECPIAVCYGCLNVALGQASPQPHDHGG